MVKIMAVPQDIESSLVSPAWCTLHVNMFHIFCNLQKQVAYTINSYVDLSAVRSSMLRCQREAKDGETADELVCGKQYCPHTGRSV